MSTVRRNRSSRGHVRRQQQTFPTWFIVVIGVVGCLAVGILLREVVLRITANDATNGSQSNRAWVGEAWTLNDVGTGEVQLLTNRLKDNHIGMIYVVTGAWRADGEYRAHPFAEQFRAKVKAIAPDLKVLVWIWVDERYYPDEISQTSAVNYTKNAIEAWGYDGVHVQGYNVFNGTESYVVLIRALDRVVGDDHILSITAPPDHSPSDPSVPRGLGNQAYSWQPVYKQQLAVIVDEIALMPFAAGLETSEDYEKWVAYQIEAYIRDLSPINVDTTLIIGIPAYPLDVHHNPMIENPTTTIRGIQIGLDQVGRASSRIIGAGLYFDSTATGEDWKQFTELWVR